MINLYDGSEYFTSKEIQEDLNRLGISAIIDEEPTAGIFTTYIINFRTNEDMNLYKIAGTIKEDYYIKFSLLGPKSNVV